MLQDKLHHKAWCPHYLYQAPWLTPSLSQVCGELDGPCCPRNATALITDGACSSPYAVCSISTPSESKLSINRFLNDYRGCGTHLGSSSLPSLQLLDAQCTTLPGFLHHVW